MIKKVSAQSQKKLDHPFFETRSDKVQNLQAFLLCSVFQGVSNEAPFLLDKYFIFPGQPANGLKN
jgi:hypothetical protein